MSNQAVAVPNKKSMVLVVLSVCKEQGVGILCIKATSPVEPGVLAFRSYFVC